MSRNDSDEYEIRRAPAFDNSGRTVFPLHRQLYQRKEITSNRKLYESQHREHSVLWYVNELNIQLRI